MTLLAKISSPINDVTLSALIILALPFFTFWFLLLFGRIINKYRGYMATSVMLGALIMSIDLFIRVWGQADGVAYESWWAWFGFEKLGVVKSTAQTFIVSAGIKVDALSSLMLLIITFVSFLVHLFSIEYIRGDRNFEKYFSYLGLFTFSMLGIVLSNNLFLIFIFWELVGLSSYLLIGFWYQTNRAAYASKKAFLTNRIGDVGFIIGLMIVWAMFGDTQLSTVSNGLASMQLGLSKSSLVFAADSNFWLTIAGIGILCGAIGKSAQFPLSIWLPNAMEGPTPVSALIHAATMVAAGVYLIARTYFLLDIEVVLPLLAVIGSITAFMAAFTAMSQFDIKRVLAFSTISQLGYMVMGLGVGAYDASLLHLVTHAFFKACLFLSAGAVIHSIHHVEHVYIKKGIHVHYDPQDMRLMGGLRKKMPVTFITYTISALALAGLPFFSGFLSKDAILTGSWAWAATMAKNGSSIWYLIPIFAFLTAFMTAFYMARQLFLVFWGEFRLAKKYEQIKDSFNDLIETPWLMRVPVIILAVLSFGFVFSVNPFNAESSWLHAKLFKSVVTSPAQAAFLKQIDTHPYHYLSMVISVGLAVLGIILSYAVFVKRETKFSKKILSRFVMENPLTKLSYNNWYMDRIYDQTFVALTLAKSKLAHWIDCCIIDGNVNLIAKINVSVAKLVKAFDRKILDRIVNVIGKGNLLFGHIVGWFDKFIVDGVVNLVAKVTSTASGVLRGSQGGYVQVYLLITVISLLVLLFWIL